MAKTKEVAVQETALEPQLLTVVEQTKVELTKAQAHALAFAPSMVTYHEIAQTLATLNRDEPTQEDAKKAREARLKMVKIRTGAESIKDERKAILLIESNLIQDLHNVVKNTCLLTESEFMAVEKHQERIEAERLEAIKQSRLSLLAPFEVDTQFIAVEQMTEEQFEQLRSSSELAFNTRKQQAEQAEKDRIEAERIAEEERLAQLEAERLERERIEKENAELKAEQDRLAKEQAEKDRLAKIESDKQAKAIADAKAEADKATALLKEKEEKEKQAQEAERKRIEDEEADKLAKEKALLLAPDKEKVKVFFEQFKSLEFPTLESEAGKAMETRVNEALQMVKQLIINDSKNLL